MKSRKGNSFTYTGPHTEVEVREPDTGLRHVAERDGKAIVVSDELAELLREQTEAWRPSVSADPVEAEA